MRRQFGSWLPCLPTLGPRRNEQQVEQRQRPHENFVVPFSTTFPNGLHHKIDPISVSRASRGKETFLPTTASAFTESQLFANPIKVPLLSIVLFLSISPFNPCALLLLYHECPKNSTLSRLLRQHLVAFLSRLLCSSCLWSAVSSRH